MSDNAESAERYRVGRRYFVYAPPLKGVRPSKRKPPNPPYRNAPTWKCSVYYYWWQYLRRHEGYQKCCAKGGKGQYSTLYADFGDVHAHDDFWRWWSKEQHSELFCEPTARQIKVLDAKGVFEPTLSDDTLTIELPLEVRTAYLITHIRKLLREHDAKAKAAKRISRAKYPVATKPVLTSLHQHLVVYDAKQVNPTLKLHELYDLVHEEAGLYVSESVDGETVKAAKRDVMPYGYILRTIKRRKTNLVKRHLNIAAQYIEYVSKGVFPYRTTR